MKNLVRYALEFEGRTLEFVGRGDVESDRAIIGMVFASQMFSTARFPRHHAALTQYLSFLQLNNKVPVIFDAGANIGVASRYFSDQYPGAKTYGIEPDKDNYSLLTTNMGNRNFVGIHGALSAKSQTLWLNTNDHDPISFRTGSSGDTEVQGYGLNDLVDSLPGNEEIFLIKIDIEGFEEEVFQIDSEYLAKVPLLVMEPHDWMLPFKGVTKNFYKEISKHDFDVLMHGENIFCFNNAILSPFKDF